MLDLRDDDGHPLPDPASTLRHSQRRAVRVTVLDELWEPLAVLSGALGQTLDGSVAQDARSDVRRELSLELANPDGVWTPEGEASLLYWHRHLRVQLGVSVGGVDFLAPQGVFLISRPGTARRGGRQVLTIAGADRMDRALRATFVAPVSYASGSGVGAVVKDILVDAGVGPDRWRVDDAGKTLGATRNYELDEECMSAARRLATDFSLDVYADADGWMVVRPKPDPLEAPVSWVFEPGAGSTLLGVSKDWSRERFYNRVRVAGEAADRTPVTASASDTNPGSPTRVGGLMGTRVYKHTSAMITTVPQAQAVADAMLREHCLIEETLRVEHVAHPGLEALDAVTIRDRVSRTDDKYAIRSMTVPFAGPASLEVGRVRKLSP